MEQEVSQEYSKDEIETVSINLVYMNKNQFNFSHQNKLMIVIVKFGNNICQNSSKLKMKKRAITSAIIIKY